MPLVNDFTKKPIKHLSKTKERKYYHRPKLPAEICKDILSNNAAKLLQEAINRAMDPDRPNSDRIMIALLNKFLPDLSHADGKLTVDFGKTIRDLMELKRKTILEIKESSVERGDEITDAEISEELGNSNPDDDSSQA